MGNLSASTRPRQPIFITGPTAVGKSDVALVIARELRGEIISVDSMQVYRGLDIGTAKPSPAQRREVPHHLIDAVDLRDSFNAAQFVRLAQVAVAEIQSRDGVPILCGGTGLYFQAFLEGLGEAPAAEPGLRSELEATPLPELLHELEQKDPLTYERIDRQNPRRVIRALEVIHLTGKPFSAQRAPWSREQTLASKSSACFFVIARSAPDLKRRIDLRVEEMFRKGLVEETRQLLDQGLADNKNAMQALGYRQTVEYLQGARSLPETVELIKNRTRQFAKRQLTWLRKHAHGNWIEIKEGEGPDIPAKRIQSAVQH